MKGNNKIANRPLHTERPQQTTPQQSSDLNFSDILRILFDRKILLIVTVLLFCGLAFLYNYFTIPIYETSALIKKEKLVNERSPDEFQRIMQLQTMDEIETEMEVLKTRTVLEKTVEKLKLYFAVKSVSVPGQSSFPIPLYLYDYENYLKENPDASLPQFRVTNFHPKKDIKSRAYYILATHKGTLELYHAKSNELLSSCNVKQLLKLNVEQSEVTVDWTNALPGSRTEFAVENIDETIKSLERQIAVTALRKTNLFKLAVQSNSPDMARLIANTLIENFRETRFEHKRQSTNYSFDLVDNQLEEVAEDLKKAEANLSDYRRRYNITRIDKNSQKIIEFLSRLETEKVETELELTEYKSRYLALRSELEEKGYFDQTYLTPGNARVDNSPFADLLRHLSNAELERLELLQKRKENHPDVQAVDQRIREIKAKLSSYNENTIAVYEISIASLQNKHEEIRELIENYSTKVKTLPVREMELMELTRQKAVYEKMFNLLMNKREQIRIAAISKLQDIVIVDPAHLPGRPIHPRKIYNLLIGAIAGTMIGIFLVFSVEFFGRVMPSKPVSEELQMPVPVLAVMPQTPHSVSGGTQKALDSGNAAAVMFENHGRYQEAFHQLEKRLLDLPAERNRIVFTSCLASDVKTRISSNFAASMSLSGKKILVIDCNFDQPQVGSFFHISKEYPGLTDYLKQEEAKPVIYRPFAQLDGEACSLDMLPAGTKLADASDLIDSQKFKAY